jgi:hypothetical protein
LCNGIEFALYRTSYTDSPILYFNIEDIDKNWDKLRSVLSPASFHAGKEHVYVTEPATIYETDFDYKNRPLLKEIPVKKQAARRHFGVHGYFTRQSWNVVSEYIKNFTRPGDLVLDPYGGRWNNRRRGIDERQESNKCGYKSYGYLFDFRAYDACKTE